MTEMMIDFGMLDENLAPVVTAPVQPDEPMLDFDFIAEPPEALAQPVQQVTVAPVGSTALSHVLKTDSAEWGWEDMRNYLISSAEELFGPQLRDPAKEAGILKSFIKRYGSKDAVMIAQAAFTIYKGIWKSAPITVTRFCKASDPYFADVILARVKG